MSAWPILKLAECPVHCLGKSQDQDSDKEWAGSRAQQRILGQVRQVIGTTQSEGGRRR